MPYPTGISRATRNGFNLFISGATTTAVQTGNGIPAGTVAWALPTANIGAPSASQFAIQVNGGGTGSFSALAINILGSLDGVNFFPVGTTITTANSMAFVSLTAIKYIAASITTATIGSGAPTVTVGFSINQ